MAEIIIFTLFLLLTVSNGAYIYDLLYKSMPMPPIIYLLISYAFGLGIGSLAIFVLGILGILYYWTIYALLIFLSLVAIPKFRRRIMPLVYTSVKGSKFIQQSFISYFLLSLIGIYILLNLIEALLPPTSFDSLVYHLADPKKFLEYHRLLSTQIPDIDLRLGKIAPFNFEMLYIIPLALNNDILANIIQYGTALLAGLALYMIGASFFSRLTGLFAVAIFLMQPFVVTYVATAKTDTAIVLYAILAIYAFFEWRLSHESRWLNICGVLAGFYLACKLSGLFFVFYLFIMIFYSLILESKLRFDKALRTSMLFLIPALIIAAPWLLRSWVVTGDPIYPYFSSIFTNNFKTEISHTMTLSSFILYPWHLVFSPGNFLGERGASPVYIAILPLLLIYRGVDKKIKYLLLFGLAYVYTFFPLHVLSRYFIAGIAALSVVSGYVIDRFSLQLRNVLFKNIMLLFLCLPLVFNLYYLFRVNIPNAGVALKMVPRDKYLEKELKDYYFMAKYVNQLPADAIIFSPWENRFYYFDRKVLSGNWIVKEMLDIRSPAEWVNVLKNKYGADYVLLTWDYQDALIKLYESNHLGYDPRDNILFSEGMKEYLVPVYSKGKYKLYKLY